MNKGELKAFALDRAIRLAEHGKLPDEVSVFKAADSIIEYLYIAEKDITETLETLIPLIKSTKESVEVIDGLVNVIVPLIRNTNNLEKLKFFILSLLQVQAEMEAGISVPQGDA